MNEAPFQDRFRQWVALELEHCREIEDMFDVLLGDSWISIFSTRIGSEPSECGWAIVQAVVQNAIHKRQWRFRITDTSNHYGNKTACYEVDVMDHDFEYFVELDYTDPAFGLFDAYLTALEINMSFADKDEEKMKPIQFSDFSQTATSTDSTIGELPVLTSVYSDGTPEIITCWQPSIWERFVILFTGRLFVHVLGYSTPPIKASIDFKHIREIERWYKTQQGDNLPSIGEMAGILKGEGDRP